MTLVTEQELIRRVKQKTNITLNSPYHQKNNKNSRRSQLPTKLKYNAFDGGDYAETYMSSRTTLR